MAISDNTRVAKMAELLLTLQQSFQNEIKNQMFKQLAKQDKVNSTLNELITGLSQS